MARGKTNYLNNKDMLKEIHKSKMSYCEMLDEKYEKPSYIINNLGTLELDAVEEGEDKTATVNNMSEEQLLDLFLSDEVQNEAKETVATQRQQEAFQLALSENPSTKPKLAQFAIDPNTIDPDDLVFRVLTYDHIPTMNERKKTHKTVADWHIKLNFTPFKHYIIQDGELVQVGLSHYKDGEFSLTCGSITNELAKMFLLLVRRYSERSNWRGYTYIDEMKGQALLQLSHMGLQFEVSRSQNPFAYFTAVLTNSFTRVLNSEKQNQNLRDNLLEAYGQNPSFSRQLQYEDEARKSREDAENY